MGKSFAIKGMLLILFIAVIANALLGTDVYIKQKAHTDAHYRYGRNMPTEDYDVELLIGSNRLAVISPGRKIIIDGTQKRMFIINRKNKTYVETTIPLDMSRVLPAWLHEYFGTRELAGAIEAGKETRDIRQWKCRQYSLKTKQSAKSQYPVESDIQYWYTSDTPVDLKAISELYANLWRFENYSENFIEVLSKQSGFPIASVTILYNQHAKTRSTLDVVEIQKKKPGPEVYSVPASFSKKEKLTYDDMLTR